MISFFRNSPTEMTVFNEKPDPIITSDKTGTELTTLKVSRLSFEKQVSNDSHSLRNCDPVPKRPGLLFR